MDSRQEDNASSPSSTFLSPRILLTVSAMVLVLLLVYPFLILVTFIAFVSGFAFIHYFDTHLSSRVDNLVANWTGLKIAPRKVRIVPKKLKGSLSSSTLAVTDPLSSASLSSSDIKRDRPNSPPNSLQIPPSTLEHSPVFTPTPYHMPKIEELNLKIDPRLDTSISKFVSTVFDYYIGPDWAPFLTRRQLKLAFKQLLTNLAERVNLRITKNPDFPVEISKRKLIPLILHYTLKIQTHLGGQDGADLIFPEEKQHKIRLRIRRLCRMIIFNCVQNEDEQKCRLWMELCIAVLSDGVFWNLFSLGRDQIPELVGSVANAWLEEKFNKSGQQDVRNDGIVEGSQYSKQDEDSDIKTPMGHDEVDLMNPPPPIPFLLDNFLDPKDSLEQPDPIVSRWRPMLKEIIDETDLLYPLIQYLKHVGGQKALAYLQAVLDDSPDARDHCRRVLEVEYLPGFCRSNFFHENMGLSRVEEGTEVVTDRSPGTARRITKSHSRSSSYGSKTNQGFSDILRIESGIVDGLPLYSNGPSSISSSQSAFSGASAVLSCNDVVETDSFFRRKSPLEDMVAKFLKSSLSTQQTQNQNQSGGGGVGGTSSSDSSSVRSLESSPSKRPSPTPSKSRSGIDSKSYHDLAHSEVVNRVKIHEEKCHVLDTVENVVISTLLSSTHPASPYLIPLLSCWLPFLEPYLQPSFDSKVDQELKDFLTLDLFITSVDLITDAFNASGTSDTNITTTTTTKANSKTDNIPPPILTSSSSNPHKDKLGHDIVQNFLRSLLDIIFVSKIVDVDKFITLLGMNRDYIFLFFVDVLDLAVAELFGDCCDIVGNENYGGGGEDDKIKDKK